MKSCVFAGTFDPITHSHVWVMRECLKLFDKVYIAIGINVEKHPVFSLDQRKEMIKNVFPNNDKLEIISFEKEFLVNLCRDRKIDVMIRGIRDVKDFEYESQIRYVNEKINNKISTLYLIPPTELSGISSSLVRGLVGFSEWQINVEKLVPKENMKYLLELCYGDKLKDKIKMYSWIKEPLIDLVINKYTENGRYYHTLQHLLEMFENIEKTKYHNGVSLAVAILLHDIVYNSKNNNNEEESVELWKKNKYHVQFLYQDDKEVDNISSAILSTKKHECVSDDNNIDCLLTNSLLDLDLMILAADETRFNEYERQIRAEYSFVDDEKYRIGRTDFVKKMLEKENIFNGALQISGLEEKAKYNLNNLLEKLEIKKTNNDRLDNVE